MMTDAEKKLLQAQHRLEEAQARDRVKERKARTRRLIQEGAILEKVLPEVRTMEPTVLEDYLIISELSLSCVITSTFSSWSKLTEGIKCAVFV